MYALESAKDEASFSKASELFIKKWRGVSSDFTEYFQQNWITKHSKWYEGAAVGRPSTNNALEATNRVIKMEHTLRKRLPVGQFMNGVGDLIRKWSADRNPASVNCVPFSESYTISLKEWTTAYHCCLLYTSPSPRDRTRSRMPSSA